MRTVEWLFEEREPHDRTGVAGAGSASGAARAADGRRRAAPPSGGPAPVLRAADFPDGPPLGPEVAGLDEAGRGPLAGPVYAACAVLPADFPLAILDDSKALTEARREEAFAAITRGALAWAIDWSTPHEIDRLNILEASLLAMRRSWLACIELLGRVPARAFVDGNRDPRLVAPDVDARGEAIAPVASPDCAVSLVVKGDAIVPAIMAASILAKVARDRMMERWDWLCPEYGYARHKGYPTAAHREACRRLGPSPIQRNSFNYDR